MPFPRKYRPFREWLGQLVVILHLRPFAVSGSEYRSSGFGGGPGSFFSTSPGWSVGWSVGWLVGWGVGRGFTLARRADVQAAVGFRVALGGFGAGLELIPAKPRP